MASFELEKFLILMIFDLSTVSVVSFVVDVISRKALPSPGSSRFIPTVSLRVLKLLALALADVAQLVGASYHNRKLAGLIPSQAHTKVTGSTLVWANMILDLSTSGKKPIDVSLLH